MVCGRFPCDMSSLLEQLGVDEDDLIWQDLAKCSGVDPSWFFEGYEQDNFIATNVDKMCKACLVRQNCEDFGIQNKETGVWGGWYLDRGKIDTRFNAHKEIND